MARVFCGSNEQFVGRIYMYRAHLAIASYRAYFLVKLILKYIPSPVITSSLERLLINN